MNNNTLCQNSTQSELSKISEVTTEPISKNTTTNTSKPKENENEMLIDEPSKKKRICNRCNIEKDIDQFLKSPRSLGGHIRQCKPCSNLVHKLNVRKRSSIINERNKVWRLKNKEKIRVYRVQNKEIYKNKYSGKYKQTQKRWYQKNKDGIKIANTKYNIDNAEIRRRRSREWSKNNLNKINARHRHRQKTDAQYKLTKILRSRFKKALKGNAKVGSAVRDLGCSIPEFKIYIEDKFLSGMSWENYGFRGWHLDHIIPLASFDLTNREEFLRACHYTNIQPLWAIDNFKKGHKIP